WLSSRRLADHGHGIVRTDGPARYLGHVARQSHGKGLIARMSALKQKLITRIKQDGPISVADYMTACLSDLEGGYYMIREPFGRKGDFITAPEVSQMFGELLGVWVVSTWQALGSPLPCTIAEIGPGRGTLMSDLLRAA